MISKRTINTLKDYCISCLSERQIERLFQDNGFSTGLQTKKDSAQKKDIFDSYLMSFTIFGDEVNRLALFQEAMELICKECDYIVYEEGHIGTNRKNELTRLLKLDGYEFVDNKFVKVNQSIETVEITNLTNLTKTYSELKSDSNKTPEARIGLSKDLLESIFKVICEENNIFFDKDEPFHSMAKKALANFRLIQTECTEKEKTIEYLRHIIQIVSIKINEIRNIHGYGHGKKTEYVPVDDDTAKLISNLALSIGTYFIPKL